MKKFMTIALVTALVAGAAIYLPRVMDLGPIKETILHALGKGEPVAAPPPRAEIPEAKEKPVNDDSLTLAELMNRKGVELADAEAAPERVVEVAAAQPVEEVMVKLARVFADPKVCHVADFGAVGDGETDDGPAIRRAVEAAVEAAPGSRVVFDEKSYRMARFGGSAHINLTEVTGLIIDGNGAEIIGNPYNGFIAINNCSNVTMRGLVFDCDPLSYTQGDITRVENEKGEFLVKLHDGYANPVELSDKLYKTAWNDVGFLIHPEERKLKRGGSDHYRMAAVTEEASEENLIRVKLDADTCKNVEPGDRFVIALVYGGSGAHISVDDSSDVHLENYTIHTAKFGMTHTLSSNRGRVYIKGVQVTFRDGSDRLVTNIKDGFHCKHNAVGPVIEDCLLEGMKDDSINISVCPYWVFEDLGNNRYVIGEVAFAPRVGDTLMAYTPRPGTVDYGFTVLAMEPHARPKGARGIFKTITLNKPIPGLWLFDLNAKYEKGGLFPGGHDKLVLTGLYNMDNCGKDYIIRNNHFGPQRRYSVLARSTGGLIEGNTITGGAGIALNNEVGSFYEGPFPGDITIRNNTFKNTNRTLWIYTNGKGAWAKNITIENNTISDWTGAALYMRAIDGGLVQSNTIDLPAGDPALAVPVSIKNSKNLMVDSNRITIRKEQAPAIRVENCESVKERQNWVKKTSR